MTTMDEAEVVSVVGCELCETQAAIGACVACRRQVCGRCSDAGTIVTGGVAHICHECLIGEIKYERSGAHDY